MEQGFMLYLIYMFVALPVILLGMLFYLVPVLRRRGAVSGVAYESLICRVMYHLTGSRKDEEALKLCRQLPATNDWTMDLLVKPLLLGSQWTGIEPQWLVYPAPTPTPVIALVAARTEFTDKAVNELVGLGEGKCSQVVVLGAGWGTRSVGMLRGLCSKVIEMDLAETQKQKIAALSSAGIDVEHVTFVPCDLMKQNWVEEAKKKGLNTKEKTLVLLEGVTMWLPEARVIAALTAASSQLCVGSCVVFDFISKEFLKTKKAKVLSFLCSLLYKCRLMTGITVSPSFAIVVGQFLRYSCGLHLNDHRSLPGTKGEVPYAGLVVAEVRKGDDDGGGDGGDTSILGGGDGRDSGSARQRL